MEVNNLNIEEIIKSVVKEMMKDDVKDRKRKN